MGGEVAISRWHDLANNGNWHSCDAISGAILPRGSIGKLIALLDHHGYDADGNRR
jgi:hypothetical protein